jgi:predicted nucleotidyltransferase
MAVTQTQIDKITSLAQSYGAKRLILFGSAVEEPDQARDIDIACDGVPGWKIFELAARLEEELRMPLDLIPLTPPSRFTKYIESKGKVLL